MFEGEDFYQLCEQNIVLYKNGKEIGRGFICYTVWQNIWEEEYDDHQRDEYDSFIVLNNKIISEDDYDYNDTVWDEERELNYSTDIDEILTVFEVIKKELIKS